jgi:hypothetical protein
MCPRSTPYVTPHPVLIRRSRCVDLQAQVVGLRFPEGAKRVLAKFRLSLHFIRCSRYLTSLLSSVSHLPEEIGGRVETGGIPLPCLLSASDMMPGTCRWKPCMRRRNTGEAAALCGVLPEIRTATCARWSQSDSLVLPDFDLGRKMREWQMQPYHMYLLLGSLYIVASTFLAGDYRNTTC